MRAFALALGIFLGSSQSFAYDFTDDFENGIYWQSFPIAISKFVDSHSEGTVLANLLDQATNEWEDVSGMDIWSVVDGYQVSNSYSGNHIRWSNNFGEETGYSPTTTLAVTVRHRVGTYFTQIEIILNGENSKLRANQDDILYQTILHEVGHTIGIDHSEYNSAVMYASLQGISSLSFDDQEAVIAIIDETNGRQESGFVSSLASESSSNGANALACGSVSLISGEGPGGGNGPGSGAATVILGFILVVLFQKLSTLSELTRQYLPLK